uniref:Uncharacterized protein n=1 Tax=Brassica oleracea TaxID=3712 RepID=A0A3P6FF69_BRAOL|nr:unnamed protein product [Brassica oleracea]
MMIEANGQHIMFTVPDIFTDVGRLSGKPKDRPTFIERSASNLQTYSPPTAEDVLQYER